MFLLWRSSKKQDNSMSSFVDRLKSALGGVSYDPTKRRSVQSAILYEAYRCIEDKLPSMKPFQRKIAFYDQARALLEATGFSPQDQVEIMWRTATSREALTPDSAWKRVRLVEKEVERIRDKVKPLCEEGKSHDDVIKEFIQQQFEIVTGRTGLQCPAGWEHAHNNVIMTYRMYYDGADPDPKLPPPEPFKEVVVPANKAEEESYYLRVGGEIAPPSNGVAAAVAPSSSASGAATTAGSPAPVESAEDRTAILKEVRAHMDLLNDFVGVIPQEQLVERKRELFQALPSAPPSTAERVKRIRRSAVQGEVN